MRGAPISGKLIEFTAAVDRLLVFSSEILAMHTLTCVTFAL
jgi:hypothetical protein